MGGLVRWVLILAVCVSFCSCNRSERSTRQTYRVTGKITIDGAPVENVCVFAKGKGAQDPKYPIAPQANTVKDGSFSFSSYKPDDGLPADDYDLTVRWQEMKGATWQGPDKLKDRYSNLTKPARTFTVKDQSVDLGTIALSTK